MMAGPFGYDIQKFRYSVKTHYFVILRRITVVAGDESFADDSARQVFVDPFSGCGEIVDLKPLYHLRDSRRSGLSIFGPAYNGLGAGGGRLQNELVRERVEIVFFRVVIYSVNLIQVLFAVR